MMSGGRIEVCYNVQTAVDAKHKLIVAEDVTNAAGDRDQLSPLATAAQEGLGGATSVVVAERFLYLPAFGFAIIVGTLWTRLSDVRIRKVVAAGVIMVLSGLAIWKPGQFQELTWLFGGFDVARVIHFLGMAAIVAFLIVHVALVIIVPKTLPAMITGRGERARSAQ